MLSFVHDGRRGGEKKRGAEESLSRGAEESSESVVGGFWGGMGGGPLIKVIRFAKGV